MSIFGIEISKDEDLAKYLTSKDCDVDWYEHILDYLHYCYDMNFDDSEEENDCEPENYYIEPNFRLCKWLVDQLSMRGIFCTHNDILDESESNWLKNNKLSTNMERREKRKNKYDTILNLLKSDNRENVIWEMERVIRDFIIEDDEDLLLHMIEEKIYLGYDIKNCKPDLKIIRKVVDKLNKLGINEIPKIYVFGDDEDEIED